MLADRQPLAGEPRGARPARAQRESVVLVASLGDSVAGDFAAFVDRGSRSEAVLIDVIDHGPGEGPSVRVSKAAERADMPAGEAVLADRVDGLIVFVGPRQSAAGRRALAGLADVARRGAIEFVCVVGSFRVHLDDPIAEEVERFARACFEEAVPTSRVVVIRPGHVLGPRSALSRALMRLAPLGPLIPRRLATCVLESSELFAAIESERLEGARRPAADDVGRALGRRRRAFTLLGANTPWCELLGRHRSDSPVQALAAAAASTRLVRLLIGQPVALVVAWLARLSPWVRQWHVGTLKPRSFRELVSLCHARNIDRVRVVGYNNGVHHFGHRHPGKTVVSTVRCRRTVRAGRGRLKADCGATIHDAMACLAEGGEELFVVPNYSYVALGTAFFVPIHGSAVDYATVADTITRVVLYDPERDRLISAERHDRDFAASLYNLRSSVVVLRLYLRARPKSRYYVRRETLKGATAADLLAALRDGEAANVEIRQGHAASPTVTVSRYYTDLAGTTGPALELPRDALGRLWDRLEENPVTSFLMHALSRHVAWHTELFFTEAEFETFWSTHDRVPLRKIQLRYIRRDGMPHSPFRDDDRVSADLFLFRADKKQFDAYTARALPTVRYNPGKHSN